MALMRFDALLRIARRVAIAAAFLFFLPTAQIWANSSKSTLQILAYHDVKPTRDALLDEFGVTVDQLAAHFAWLRHQGYVAINIDDLLDAQSGKRALPDKAVLITFDDGLASFYEHAFPLLKLYGFPAVVALVGSWQVDDKPIAVTYGEKSLTRDTFLTTRQIKELTQSPLIEFASHSYDLHRGHVANASGQTQPAAIAREWNATQQTRESREKYTERVRSDLSRSIESIVALTGKRPRVIAWPYGEYNAITSREAASLGLTVGFSLTSATNQIPGDLTRLGRHLVSRASTVTRLSYSFGAVVDAPVRFIGAALDPLLGKNKVEQEKLLDQMVERLHLLGATHVILNALSQDGATATFGTTHLASEDLLNRITWQLRTRLGLAVFVRWPVRADTITGSLASAFDDLLETVSVTGLVLDHRAASVPDTALVALTSRTRALHPDDYLVWQTRAADAIVVNALANQQPEATRPRALMVAADAEVDLTNAGSGNKRDAPVALWREFTWGASVSATEFSTKMRALQRKGQLNFGWSEDDFRANAPDAAVLAPAFSRRVRVR